MGMPRGLAKATNYYNRLEAWNDWNKIAFECEQKGFRALALKHKPPSDAGWRKIDKAIAKLRAEMQAEEEKRAALSNQPDTE